MAHPLVSIVIPTRGRAALLGGLFDALERQSSDDWEAVVVIDGDIDDSESVVLSASKTLPVRPIVFEANRGRAAALNAGFDAAGGDVLVRCDDDLVPGPDFVRGHAAAHEGRRVGVVGLYRNIYPDTAYARAYGRGWDEQFRREAYQADGARAWRYWAGNCSVTQDSWHEVGEYDTAFRSYGWEDVDWGYRLHRAGVPVVIEPTLEVDHLGPSVTTEKRAERAYYAGAAKRRFEAKHDIQVSPRTPASTWDRTVSVVRRSLDEKSITRFGRGLDRSAALMPDPVARKAIALLVEASSVAGYRSGETHGAI